MKKELTVIIVIIFLLIGVNVSASFVKETKKVSTTYFDGNILYVGGSGPNNYTKIQDAINDSVDGDTVFVYDESSPYYEYITIGKTILLLGEDKNTTIIDASYNASPESMKEALSVLAVAPTRKIAVLGSMNELGQISEIKHSELGAFAASRADIIVTVGDSAKWIDEGALSEAESTR